MASLSLSLLGSFQALVDGQSVGTFRTNKAQALLVYLAVERERAHRREHLMTLLWPDMPLQSAQVNLRQVLYRLRQMFPDVSDGVSEVAPLLLSDRQTVQINPDAAVEVDLHQFATLLDQVEGHEHPDLGRCSTCLKALEAGVALYRGNFLDDFYLDDSNEFEDWAQAQRESYRNKALDALERLAEAALAAGAFDRAIKVAERELGIDPLRESAHRSLVEALARSGRRRTALTRYETFRELLQDELGVDPSNETQRLVAAIRNGELEPTPAPAVPDAPPPPPQPTAVQPFETMTAQPIRQHEICHNLPSQPTPFIGREAELAELENLLTDSETRLVTITAPGGMGKTRLALACAEIQLARRDELAAHPYEDGIFFVDLAPLNEHQQIPLAIAEALQIQLGGGNGGVHTPQQQLLDYLADKQILLLLDNFENLLAGADLVAKILQAAPRVQVLVTSRERLHLRPERLYPIPGLAFPDWETPEDAAEYSAAQLFLGAARHIRPGFELAASDLAYLTHICRLVGGMPLALELAAGWVELLPLAEIAAEIERGLSILETELQDVPDRHRSMRIIFDSTWERLEPVEQEMLAKLSVFRGGFTREAAQQVAVDQQKEVTGTLRLLARLVSKSLLQVDPTRGHYQIHELLRQYAGEQLESSGELENTRAAHAVCYLNMLRQQEAAIKGGRELKKALDEIEVDFPNIGMAWTWALEQGNLDAIDLALEALFYFFSFRGRHYDGVIFFQRVEKLLATSSAQNSKRLGSRIAARRIFLDQTAWVGDLDKKLLEIEKIVADARNREDLLEIAFSLFTLGFLQGDVNFSASIKPLLESQSIYDHLGDSFYKYWFLGQISWVYLTNGQPEKRVEFARQQLEMARNNGDSLTAADALGAIGVVAEMAGRYAEAEKNYQEALLVFREFGDRFHISEYVSLLSWLPFLKGDFSNARALITEGMTLARQYNLKPPLGLIHGILGFIRCAEEHYEQAINLFQGPIQMGPPPTAFKGFSGMAYARCGLGDFAFAKEHLNKALDITVPMKAVGWQVQCLPAAALIAASEDRLERAAELLALALHHPIGGAGWLERFPLIIRLRTRLETELSPAALEGARYRGQRLSLGETIQSLLGERGGTDRIITPILREVLQNLPAQPTPFIGREAELASLDKLLANPDIRLVTIVGPGGMGKTRLALAWAEKQLTRKGNSPAFPYEDGIFFVNLAPLNQPQQIALAVTEALQIQLGGGEGGMHTPRQQLLDFLADKQLLFVLDNFEHLLAGAGLVSEILQAAPEVQILVTSRERLRLRQEQLFPIPGLDFPDWEAPEDAAEYTATQLFLESARRVRPDFKLGAGDLVSLTRIGRLVGGMPLALELAAGWVELLPLAKIAAEIERSLGFLETDLQDVPDRHRSMRIIFESTWEQLEPAEQEMMEKLSIFRGGFTWEAASQVAAFEQGSPVSLRLLGRLVSKSLLQADPTRGRYQVHELLRQYSWEQLEGSGKLGTVRKAHATYYLDLLYQREGDIKGGREQKEALDVIEADLANIRAAWDWALNQGDLELIDQSLEALFWFFWFHSRQLDGVILFWNTEKVLAARQDQDAKRTLNRVIGRRICLDRAPNLGDPIKKVEEAKKILAAAQQGGKQTEIAFAFYTLGQAYIDFGAGFPSFGWKHPEDSTDILKSFREGLALYREMGDSFYEGQILDWLSAVLWTYGLPEERVRIARQRFEIAETSGDRLSRADALAQIGVGVEMTGRYKEAEGNYMEALPVFQAHGDRWHHAEYSARLGGLAFLKGELDRARTLVVEGQGLVRQFNIKHVMVYIQEHLGIIRCAEEQYQQAVELCQDIVLSGYPPTMFNGRRGMFYALCGLEDFAAAREHLREGLEMAAVMKAPAWQVQCLPAAALLAANENRLARAAELLALAYHHPAGATGWLEVFPLVTRLRAYLEAKLSPEGLETAWEKGKGLELGETIAALLEELGK